MNAEVYSTISVQNRNSIKLNIQHVVVYMLFVALFKPYFMPQVVQQIMKCFFLLLVLIYVIHVGKGKYLLNASLAFSGCVLVSSIYNFVSGNNAFKATLDGVLYAICFYVLYTTTEFFSKAGKMQSYINCLYKITLVYCIVSFLTIKFPVGYERGVNLIYAFGNKFSTSYYFILFDALFCIKYADRIKKKLEYKIRLICILLLSLVYAYLVDCMTADFALLAVIILFFILKNIRRLLTRPIVVAIATVVSLMFPFLLTALIQNERIQNFIYIVLGRQRSVGGRINIYSIYLIPLLKEHLWLGYGYSSGKMYLATGGYYGNTQNGLLEHIYNFGIIGGFVLFVFIIYVYKKSKHSEAAIFTSIIVYALIIAGLVEVTYGFIFFLGLVLVRWMPSGGLKSNELLSG